MTKSFYSSQNFYTLHIILFPVTDKRSQVNRSQSNSRMSGVTTTLLVKPLPSISIIPPPRPINFGVTLFMKNGISSLIGTFDTA